MYTVLTWVVLALFPVTFSYRDSLTYPVPIDKENWFHGIGWMIRAALAVYACPSEFQIAYAFYFWIVFDGSFNLFTNRTWNYIGTTAEFDKALRKIGGNWVKFVGFIMAIAFSLKLFDGLSWTIKIVQIFQ